VLEIQSIIFIFNDLRLFIVSGKENRPLVEQNCEFIAGVTDQRISELNSNQYCVTFLWDRFTLYLYFASKIYFENSDLTMEMNYSLECKKNVVPHLNIP